MKTCSRRDHGLEKAVLAEVSADNLWEIAERFNGIVRETGSEGERAAVKILADKLASWNIIHKIYTPTLFVSLPRGASLKVLGPAGRTLKAKTPSFSRSTAPGSITADLSYLGSGYAETSNDIFAGIAISDAGAVKGKAVLTEGLPLPGRVTDLMAAGTAAVVYISPGERIHEGICTSIWGAPDLDSIQRKPSIPVVSVSRSDGLWLKGLLDKGPVQVDVKTELEEGWKPVSVLVAEIKGSEDPDKFVLVHGHLDSWHVGVTDNATGNATLLEVARVLSKFKDRLKRSVRVAWWSGHSHGRYAGSTWYADNFALDILENCIAHVNCDSTGCRDATAYAGVSMTKEFEPLATQAIKDVAGTPATGARVPRAGDCSFANLGVGTFYMLLSSIPEDVRKVRGLYHVGGSGGNNEWHHEDDTIQVADRANLLRDTKVYALSVLRAANSTVLPYDLVGAANEIRQTVDGYVREAKGFDMTSVVQEAGALGEACGRLAAKMAPKQAELEAKSIQDPEVKALNEAVRAVDRLLVRVNYIRGDYFKHDPALEWAPVPDLAAAVELGKVKEGSDRYYLLCSHLRRGANKVAWTLREARQTIEGVL